MPVQLALLTTLVPLFALLSEATAATPSIVYDFDPSPAWPLCGRIHENPPNDSWNETDGCPVERHGNPLFNDTHIRSTFGSRPLKSEGERYDFHRGIDISAPIGTALFAIADGEVVHFGPKSGYSDPVIIIRHKRPGQNSYTGYGSYHAMYMHVKEDCCPTLEEQQALLGEGEKIQVQKGDFLGYSGADGDSGYEHLHFEVRSAPPEDKYSYWSRDAVHPLHVLPYQAPDDGNNNLTVVPSLDGENKSVAVVFEGLRKDINAIFVELRDANNQTIIQQSATPDSNGYLVNPPSFEMDEWNRMYSHKDSSSVPWESFQAGGDSECPYHQVHANGDYDPNYHMDQADENNLKIGSFNGVTVELKEYGFYSGGSEDSSAGDYKEGRYYLKVTFHALEQLDAAECVVGKVKGASDDSWEAVAQWCKGTTSSTTSAVSPLTSTALDSDATTTSTTTTTTAAATSDVPSTTTSATQVTSSVPSTSSTQAPTTTPIPADPSTPSKLCPFQELDLFSGCCCDPDSSQLKGHPRRQYCMHWGKKMVRAGTSCHGELAMPGNEQDAPETEGTHVRDGFELSMTVGLVCAVIIGLAALAAVVWRRRGREASDGDVKVGEKSRLELGDLVFDVRAKGPGTEAQPKPFNEESPSSTGDEKV